MNTLQGVVSISERVAVLAAERPGEAAFSQLAADGTEPTRTWAELEDGSVRLAGALAARGLAAGDRLGLGLRNSVELVLAVLAGWKLGAVPVPVRWDLPAWESTRLREVVDARVFLGPADLPWIAAAGRRARAELPGAVPPRMHGICSSGSTGMPKVIVTNRPGIWEDRLSVVLADTWTPVPRPQTVLVPGPMYHANGFSALYQLLAGDRVLAMERFDAERVVDVVERHRVTTFTATPTMLQRIADLPGIERRDLSSLVWILQGAAPMPPSLVHRWASLIGAERIYLAYGMTEGLGVAAVRGDEWMRRPGTVGRGVRGTEIRVLDADGRDVPAGDLGEIHLRSPFSGGSSQLGVAPQPRGTADGFRSVGDVGFLDADGYLHVVDRRVDLIVTGGANVFPAEVEAALVDHPGIADVVVVGLRDHEWGRRVHAIVEPADPAAPPTAADVVAWARSRLAPYKVPKTVELVTAIPRSEATKVNRAALVAARDTS